MRPARTDAVDRNGPTVTRVSPGDELLGATAVLYWAAIFFIIAIIAAFFGFGGVAVASAGIAKILFFIFLVVFVVSLVLGLVRRA
jgi:uncharacterized membrane protein YtjA (UPF0391 family)